ncbi:flavin reductase family protein [Pseudonocardia lutea]|uniref:Flavin reductase family protein n=1 Tax=Pseudonocardia lutea TaxID=2172015 RepID=A0ABW1I0H0_9PSEU
MLDRRTFRDVVGRFASGVTVITTAHEGVLHGGTASAFTSLSDDPPSVVVCLNRTSNTCAAIRQARRFAVNILTEQQAALAARFAGKGEDKFRGIGTLEEGGIPLLADAHAHLVCEVEQDIESGTHVVLIARVTAARIGDGLPLAYYRGGFGRFHPRPPAA